MNCTIWRVESLNIVEALRHGPHSDNAVTVINVQTLDLCTSMEV